MSAENGSVTEEQTEQSDFSKWLAAKIKQRGWNTAEFARQSGIPNATVSSWTRKDRKPSLLHHEAIALTLGTTTEKVVRAIVGEEEDDALDRITYWIMTRPDIDELDGLETWEIKQLEETLRILYNEVRLAFLKKRAGKRPKQHKPKPVERDLESA